PARAYLTASVVVLLRQETDVVAKVLLAVQKILRPRNGMTKHREPRHDLLKELVDDDRHPLGIMEVVHEVSRFARRRPRVVLAAALESAHYCRFDAPLDPVRGV